MDAPFSARRVLLVLSLVVLVLIRSDERRAAPGAHLPSLSESLRAPDAGTAFERDGFGGEQNDAFDGEAREGSEGEGEKGEEEEDKRLESERRAQRGEYMVHLMRDPATGRIPPRIRSRELAHAGRQPVLNQPAAVWSAPGKRGDAAAFQWYEVGPNDLGGRTRALALDRANPRRILAGGVSGGMWLSNTMGSTWNLISRSSQHLSVTSLVQDPRPGKEAIWYYASGEFLGNSASDPEKLAFFMGSGLYKSEDNGFTWTRLPAAGVNDPTRFDSAFDFVSRLVISPTTGSLFVANNGIGIFRSQDGGRTFGPNGPTGPGRNFIDPVLGGIAVDHYWSDVAVGANGVLIATLSRGFNTPPLRDPGVYLSTNDGDEWINITPFSYPSRPERSVVAFAPSNPDIAFVFTISFSEDGVPGTPHLFRYDLGAGEVENLTQNLPDFTNAGFINPQFGYNMALAVKPDDEDFVLLGATNLYRSRTGFREPATNREDVWIGGYEAIENRFVPYANHHPDQHAFVFDPTHPDRLLVGNDGGVYMTEDITVPGPVTWINLNDGYNVTQFYTVAVPDRPDDFRIAGGTQDQGTPYIRLNGPAEPTRDLSGGDGGPVYFTPNFMYSSRQYGRILRLRYNRFDDPTIDNYSYVHPANAGRQRFITPYSIDPSDESVMYYADGDALWRNSSLTSIPAGQTDEGGTAVGWTRLSLLQIAQHLDITAMAVSTRPAHVLYYGASDISETGDLPPRLYRLDEAHTALIGARDISIPGIPPGSYVLDIAVHPDDADEILVVHSNYNIEGLFHSTDGGRTYSAVEGNLAGTPDEPGPSLRAAAILPINGRTYYLLGTSTGLYLTTDLDGNGTVWSLNAPDNLGNAVVWDVAARPADGLVAVATHGRGLFIGTLDDSFDVQPVPSTITLQQNYPNPFSSETRIRFDIAESSRVRLTVFDALGRLAAEPVAPTILSPGSRELPFDASNLASGLYVYCLEVTPLDNPQATFVETRTMTLVR